MNALYIPRRIHVERSEDWATFLVICWLIVGDAVERVITAQVRAVSKLQAETVFGITHPELAGQDRRLTAEKIVPSAICTNCGHTDHNHDSSGLPCPNCGETLPIDD